MSAPAERQSPSPRTLIWMIACGVYVTAMFIGTHAPLKLEPITAPNGDKLLHLAGYAGLGFLLAWGLALRSSRPRWLWCAYAAILLWAGMDEVTQPMVGRTADVYDWLADASGSGFGMLSAWGMARLLRVEMKPPALESEIA
ncbi:MAG: VanZ family protein [Planctomycetaceae bacterium]|nr:VanZ family protein [Planctomycetaceae bacterium]